MSPLPLGVGHNALIFNHPEKESYPFRFSRSPNSSKKELHILAWCLVSEVPYSRQFDVSGATSSSGLNNDLVESHLSDQNLINLPSPKIQPRPSKTTSLIPTMTLSMSTTSGSL
ncbi:unnamed protein product [Microthlaspi erraticum]|uniref:Uncharacterized protein n=1 Tax=Microthlaspi erraticum TaxID=1685480 RepID=A0A6D2HMR8_9BRAS|nr:unnamed protein product [Microthlaspi erraticum]